MVNNNSQLRGNGVDKRCAKSRQKIDFVLTIEFLLAINVKLHNIIRVTVLTL